jgi:hypothetical protein
LVESPAFLLRGLGSRRGLTFFGLALDGDLANFASLNDAAFDQLVDQQAVELFMFLRQGILVAFQGDGDFLTPPINSNAE